MAELIDRQAAIDKICEYECNCKFSDCPIIGVDSDDYCDHIRILIELPTIEPEVRHGRWILNSDDDVVCNQCRHPRQIGAKDFCGKCGADMREVCEDV